MKNFIQPKTKTILKVILRVLVTVVLIIPIMLMSLLEPEQIPNLYVLMLFKNLIPLTVAGYLLFGVADQVCAMFSLYDKEGDEFNELVDPNNLPGDGLQNDETSV